MTSILLDQLRSKFTSTAVGDLAGILNETTPATQNVIDGLLPALTTGVANRAGTDEGATVLYKLLTTTPFDADPSMEQLVETADHRQKAANSGNGLLNRLFDNNPSQRLAEAVAQYGSIKIDSATTLTGLATSILMGYLHKQVTSRSLTQPQLVTLLRGEADTARQAVPAALAGLLGWFIGTGRPITTTTTAVPASTVVHTEDRSTGTPWWRWLLYALAALLLLLLLLRGCNKDKTDTTTTQRADETMTDTVATSTGAGTDSAAGPEVRVGVDLPGGRKLNVAENSFNYSLAKYLAEKNRTPNKVFTFDNLTFETNSAQITAKARPHVDDLIQIMQAYPTLNIRIEGNTDSTGPEDVNYPLSADRADAVKAALVKAGIDTGRITTKERGETKPVASNKTETGREKNRRIDVVVTKV